MTSPEVLGPPNTPPSADYPVNDIVSVPVGDPDYIPVENRPPG